MKIFKYIFFLFLTFQSFAQKEPNFETVDSLYREDQFYVGITYNVLNNKPSGVSQNSFSTGVSAGFLRDFPINKNRTFAIAPGLGLSYNNYKENLIVNNINDEFVYSTIPANIEYDKNKLALYFVDLPIELRWRTSTFNSHIFWRIYTGFKFSYLVFSQSRYVDAKEDLSIYNNPNINKFQYGCYISLGRNTFNFYAYYGLQNIFKNGTIDNKPLNMNTFNLGMIFYIL
jgi:hypothetical protein